jgi:hypothetical protein
MIVQQKEFQILVSPTTHRCRLRDRQPSSKPPKSAEANRPIVSNQWPANTGDASADSSRTQQLCKFAERYNILMPCCNRWALLPQKKRR